MPEKLNIQLFAEGAPEGGAEGEATESAPGASAPEEDYSDYGELKEKSGRYEAMLAASREYAVEKQCSSWLSEAENLKKEHPGFDFETEMQNPTFRTGLRLGMDMKTLYRGMHFDEAAESVRKRAALSAAEGVRKSLSRPGEVGIKGPRAVRSVTDVAALSDDEMDEIVKRIARGDKVSFS